MFLLVVLCVSAIWCSAESGGPMPLQSPAVSRTKIAFVYAGSVWIMDRNDGEASRLTAQPGDESSPVFSPNGEQLALSKNVGGNIDVYVVSATGGELRRLTYHPRLDIPHGWTPDGKNVLFGSLRDSNGYTRLFTVSSQGGFPSELPLPMGTDSSFSPDGTRLAYNPSRDVVSIFNWRNYRGGETSPIWIAKLSDNSIETIPRENANDREPMWIGDHIYFLSDRTGTVNLFAYATGTKKVTRLTNYEKYDIKAAAAWQDAIAFVQGGTLYLYDLKTNQTRKIEVNINFGESDRAETKPRSVPATRWLGSYNLSPNGDQALFDARGEILTISSGGGEARILTNTSGTAERFPSWSPDGKWIAYFSDESGEYLLHLRPASGAGNVRKLAIEPQPSFYEEPVWSPDSKRVAFSDKRLALWIMDIETGTPRRIDSSIFSGQGTFRPSWSMDGKWVAYAKSLPNRIRTIFVHSIDTAKSYQVTDGRSETDWPVFDKNGKYMYFMASSNAGPSRAFGMTSFPFRANVTSTMEAVVLQKDERSPLIPASSEAGTAAAAKGIDVDGIAQRIVRLPIPARDYQNLSIGKSGILFFCARLL